MVSLDGLDLFSGIGGLTLALEPWVRPIAYCESDRYAQGVLLNRMRLGHLPLAPICDDVRDLKSTSLPFMPDIFVAGFPCQDISSAGTRRGLDGERSGLFFEITRLVREFRPAFIFLENVPDVTARGLDRIGMEFTSLGYDCRWTIVSAQAVGAAHIRERWFLLAYTNRERGWIQSRRRNGADGKNQTVTRNFSPHPSDSHGKGLEGCGRKKQKLERPASYDGWKSEPTVRGGVNGLPNRVDRIKCLGNSVVPLQARGAFKRLCGLT